MRRPAPSSPSSLRQLKRAIAETLVKSKLDYTDYLYTVIKFFVELNFVKGESASGVAKEWRAFLKAPRKNHLFELYLHFPYCKTKCSYCFTFSKGSATPERIKRYLKTTAAEIDFFAPLFKDVAFDVFCVGGGTPNLLSAAQLKEFCGPMADAFKIRKNALISIEFNPNGTDRAKLETVRALGFNRISFGVQSLNDRILKTVNRRGQETDMVTDAVHTAKAVGFPTVNTDLVFGMTNESVESFLKSFRRVAEIRPTELTVCTLSITPPYTKVTGITKEQYADYFDRYAAPAFEGAGRIAR